MLNLFPLDSLLFLREGIGATCKKNGFEFCCSIREQVIPHLDPRWSHVPFPLQDYVLVVPEASYSSSYLNEEPLDKSYDFISNCGQNSFFIKSVCQQERKFVVEPNMQQ